MSGSEAAAAAAGRGALAAEQCIAAAAAVAGRRSGPRWVREEEELAAGRWGLLGGEELANGCNRGEMEAKVSLSTAV
jgi:hypothetical protein